MSVGFVVRSNIAGSCTWCGSMREASAQPSVLISAGIGSSDERLIELFEIACDGPAFEPDELIYCSSRRVQTQPATTLPSKARSTLSGCTVSGAVRRLD